jgi:hypothetical protein
MNIEDEQTTHICTNTGNRSIGFCALDINTLENLVNANATADEMKTEIRKWIEVDAAINVPIEADDQEGYRVAFLRALASNNPFVIYCVLCFESFALISPQAAP